MEEIFRLCDTVTVLRDGSHVATRPARELTSATLVQMMIGRPLDEYFPSHVGAQAGRRAVARRAALEPGQVSRRVVLRCGPARSSASRASSAPGARRSRRRSSGSIRAATGGVSIARHAAVASASPAARCALGIGLVPEDRKRQGLVLSMTALAEHDAADPRTLSRWTFIRRRAERELVGPYFDRLRVRAPAPMRSPRGCPAATSRSSCSPMARRATAAS